MENKAIFLTCLIIILCGIEILSQQEYSVRLVFPGEQEPQVSSKQEEEGPKCTAPDGTEGTCQPLIACVSYFENVSDIERSSCSLGNNEVGLCCTPSKDVYARSGPPLRRANDAVSPQSVELPTITGRDLNSAGTRGRQTFDEIVALEKELESLGLLVKPGTKEAFHLAFFGSNPELQKIRRDGAIGLQASLELAKRFSLSGIQGRDGLPRFSLKNTVINDTCPKPPPCPSSKYRKIDGSCNNLQNPTWGKSFTAFQRFIRPKYFDGIDGPRIASDGGPLPSPRKISVMANPDKDISNEFYTLILMQFAQFLDHDLTLTAVTKSQNNEGILCCDPQILRNPRLRHPACAPIEISSDDIFYSEFKESCMEFVRSLPAPRRECTFGYREQINQLTAYIDGSNIYGSTEEESTRLRSFQGGKLKVTKLNNEDMLPKEHKRSEDCQIQTEACFLAGDERVNEQINLAVMHTLWMREHNRIADELSKQNPGWNDEILFQEARRIVGAELQHIAYNEFLPLLLGSKVMQQSRLLLKRYGYSSDYDTRVDASIANGFAAAAYRYGHTLVQGFLHLMEPDGKVSEQVRLATTFFNPILLYRPGYIDKFLRGLVSQPAQKYDRFITSQLTNHLFEPLGTQFGLDLVAINTQRGRDHGLPGYNDWREWCGFGRFKSFDELERVMAPQSVNAYRTLYRSVDDIDLFTAGVSEYSVPDGTLGPTFACVAGEQFRRLKVGDRFWYENGKLEPSFTEDQLRQIRRASLARVICDNSETMKEMQPLAFIRESRWNPKVSCNNRQIPRMDFKPWRNEPVWS